MRKYRGLTKEGELVYGWYFTFQGCKDGQEFTQHLIGDLENHDEVIPETVVQFTGRKDKNKKEVYDKDILKTPGNQRILVEIDNLIDGDGKFRSILIEECEIIGTEL